MTQSRPRSSNSMATGWRTMRLGRDQANLEAVGDRHPRGRLRRGEALGVEFRRTETQTGHGDQREQNQGALAILRVSRHRVYRGVDLEVSPGLCGCQVSSSVRRTAARRSSASGFFAGRRPIGDADSSGTPWHGLASFEKGSGADLECQRRLVANNEMPRYAFGLDHMRYQVTTDVQAKPTSTY